MCGRMSIRMANLDFNDRLAMTGMSDRISLDAAWKRQTVIPFFIPQPGDERKDIRTLLTSASWAEYKEMPDSELVLFPAIWMGHVRSESLDWWRRSSRAGRTPFAAVKIPAVTSMDHINKSRQGTILVSPNNPITLNAVAFQHGDPVFRQGSPPPYIVKIVTEDRTVAGELGRWPVGGLKEDEYRVTTAVGRTY